MSKYITCNDDFQNTLREVDLILDYAKLCQKDTEKYYTFIKSALILLVSKFEAFLEDSIVDYVEAIKKLELHPQKFPEILKLHALDVLVSEKFISDVRGHRLKALSVIEEMSKICLGDEKIRTFNIDTKFDYGKHGGQAMSKLFSRIGIKDVFGECKIFEKRETLSSDEKISVQINISADIDALTNIRNNILHSDATPSLTHEQIEMYKNHIVLFSAKLVETLESSINIVTLY